MEQTPPTSTEDMKVVVFDEEDEEEIGGDRQGTIFDGTLPQPPSIQILQDLDDVERCIMFRNWIARWVHTKAAKRLLARCVSPFTGRFVVPHDRLAPKVLDHGHTYEELVKYFLEEQIVMTDSFLYKPSEKEKKRIIRSFIKHKNYIFSYE